MHQDGAAVDDLVDFPAHAANQLGYLGSTIAQAFETALPTLRPTAARPTQLWNIPACSFRTCSWRADAARLANDAARIVNGRRHCRRRSTCPGNPPVGAHANARCDKRWRLSRASRRPDRRSPSRGPAHPVPGRRSYRNSPRYEKEEEAILRATATLQGRCCSGGAGSYEELDSCYSESAAPCPLSVMAGGRRWRGRFCFRTTRGTPTPAPAAIWRNCSANHVPWRVPQRLSDVAANVAGCAKN